MNPNFEHTSNSYTLVTYFYSIEQISQFQQIYIHQDLQIKKLQVVRKAVGNKNSINVKPYNEIDVIINNIINNLKAEMKPTITKTPVLEQLYNQRYQYQQHKQKLMKIYKDRKSQLGHDTHRTTSFQGIKQIRSRSFIHKFNQQNAVIAKENQRFAGKLESVRPSVRRSVSEERQRSTHSYLTPFLKSRLVDTEKQNHRISQKMRNMSSSLNQKNFVKDYAKSQKIKNRLMKYSAQDSRVFLKSERYLNQNQENQSVLSHSKDKGLKIKENSQSCREEVTDKSKIKKPIISHYRREEIAKNKIDTATSSLAGIKARAKERPNTSLQLDKIEDNTEANFFTTQPNRQRKIGPKKVYM